MGTFTLVNDKSLGAEAYLGAWSPDKDVVAIATLDCQLTLYRLNWQRLWAITTEEQVTALGWRPDGRVLVVGNHDGSLHLRDVEDGELQYSCRAHAAPIDCICWGQEEPSLSSSSAGSMIEPPIIYQDRTSLFFAAPGGAPADLPELGGGGSLLSEEGLHDEDGARLAAQEGPVSMLCSGDRTGQVCVSVGGMFTVASVTFGGEELRPAGILKIAIGPDFRQITAICRATRVARPGSATWQDASRRGGEQEEEEEQLYRVAFEIPLISDRRLEVRQVAEHVARVRSLLAAAEGHLAAMRRCWAEGRAALPGRLHILSTLLKDHGSSAEPAEELLAMLAGGTASPALHLFLASTVGEKGLKKLTKDMEGAAAQMYKLATCQLQVALEEVCFRLGELRALARWHEQFAPLGLHEAEAAHALEHAGMALVQSERVVRLVASVSFQHGMFYTWLTKCLRQLNGDTRHDKDALPPVDTAVVAEFLHTCFERDPVGPHLAPAEEGHIIALSVEEEEAACELALCGGFADSAYLTRTLQQQLNALSASCQAMWTIPVSTVSATVCQSVPLMLTQLPKTSAGLPPGVLPFLPIVALEMYLQEGGEPTQKQRGDHETYVAYLPAQQAPAGPPGLPEEQALVVLRWRGNDVDGAQAEAAALIFSESLRIVDVAFYKERQLAVLVQHRQQQQQQEEEEGGSEESEGAEGAGHLLLLSCEEACPFRPLAALAPNPPEKARAADHATGGGTNGATGGVADHQGLAILKACKEEGAVMEVDLTAGKSRQVAHHGARAPLVVGASRGLACIFSASRRVLVYDLEEDEEDREDAELE